MNYGIPVNLAIKNGQPCRTPDRNPGKSDPGIHVREPHQTIYLLERALMAAKYTDADIANFLEERKPLEANFRSKIRLREKRGHKEQELDIQGVNGNQFRLVLRQSSFNALDFSIILAYRAADNNQIFRLRRYNGKSHEHTNVIESDRFYDFHMHTATERYQELGAREDGYAEPSKHFSDFHSAVNCMLSDCAMELPRDPQMRLFEEI